MPRRPATRSWDPHSTRRAILDAAERLFCEHGFAATSLADIAHAAQVTKSLIAHHFGSKDTLWETVKGEMFATYAARQRAQLESRTADAALLVDALRDYFTWLGTHRSYLRLMAWRDLEHAGDLSPAEAELLRLGRQRMHEAQAAGVFHADLDIDAALFAVFAMLEAWYTSGKRSACTSISDSAYLETVLRLLSRGLLVERTP